ncbi:exonuclease domain-containing protein [Glutamicibacter sp. AOP38-B1-38]|uniref:exonuclease domain-containing protein n=1 Tax=Glutamicibacter sp. AOP38-B1-38 TaxID=3457680 RepID=UPI004033CF9B
MDRGLFAVIDTETTGLFPGAHDRIAEIAVLRMDRQGQIVDRWETLVNPGRDLGKQSIHGIQARDVLQAPSFEQIADELEWRLSGTVAVAHNLSFDARFLEAEFARAGRSLPDFYLPRGLCTMRMSHQFLQGAGRSLQDCCDSFGITLQQAHSAAGDAEATAVLLSRYLELEPTLPDWDQCLEQAAGARWRTQAPEVLLAPAKRSVGDSASAEHFLERLVQRLPEMTGAEQFDDYFAVLDQALIDRYLSAHEQAQLIELAGSLGIDRARAVELHLDYFASLATAAWHDGVLTGAERSDLQQVAKLLGIGQATLEQALLPPARGDSVATVQGPGAIHKRLEPGSLIVLTGEMSRPRVEMESLLTQAGYKLHPAVTKKVGMLVAADPDSLSGKARKARHYGLPVVGEQYLWDHVLNC